MSNADLNIPKKKQQKSIGFHFQMEYNFSEILPNFSCLSLKLPCLFCQLGAAAVNLVAGEKPADVYSGIADR